METGAGLKTGRVLLSAKDRPGIHEAIFRVIRKEGYNVADPSGKSIDGYYLLRNEFTATNQNTSTIQRFEQQFNSALKPLGLENLYLKVIDAERKKKTAILVSKITYCMEEVLNHWKQGDLNLEISGVISNSKETREVIRAYPGLKFHYVYAGDKKHETPKDFERYKKQAEERIWRLTHSVDFYTLAKWRRILNTSGPILNPELTRAPVLSIHPSPLPSFPGNRAVADAYESGVKITGATAHLITREDEDVDRGPKIVQVTKEAGNLDRRSFDKVVQFAEREALYNAIKILSEDRYLIYPDPDSGTRKTFIF